MWRAARSPTSAPDAQGIRAFKGIPYAAPPVGGLRWKPPQAVQAWSGLRSATEWGPRCMQSNRLGDLDPLNTRMDEDCLYLNVWTSGEIGGGEAGRHGLDPWRQQSQRRRFAA